MPPSTHSSTVLAPFQSLFSAPTWRKVQRLIIGTLLARGRRTVTAALRHTGQGNTPSFSLYHHVLNRARWSALKGSRRLLTLLVQTFGTVGGSLTFVIDETLERRWGPRLKKRGPLPRRLGIKPQARRDHQRAALDRLGSGHHATLEPPQKPEIPTYRTEWNRRFANSTSKVPSQEKILRTKCWKSWKGFLTLPETLEDACSDIYVRPDTG